MPEDLAKAGLPIFAVTPFSMLDFPNKTACIIWLSGCNMRCPYCHNPQIVKGKGRADIAEIMGFLAKRVGLLDGVVLSGGEATAYKNIINLARDIKKMGFAIKLDTNGLRPQILDAMIEQNLVDYVAIDYKAPPEKFRKVTGTEKFDDFHNSLKILIAGKIPFEVRTTIHTALIDENDINFIIKDLEGLGFKGIYNIQNFRNDNERPTLGKLPPQTHIFDKTQIKTPSNFQIAFRNF